MMSEIMHQTAVQMIHFQPKYYKEGTFMKSSIVIKTLLLTVFTLSLLAPFTFLKDKVVNKNADELAKNELLNAQLSNEELIKSKEKIIIKKKIEKPLHKVPLPDFSKISDIKTKKKAFFNFIKPPVVRLNKEILITRKKVSVWQELISKEEQLTEEQVKELDALVGKYRVNRQASIIDKLNELLIRVDVIPMPLVLVQAANESAWGTSRFSRVGLNFFGIWCYQKGCGMVPGGRNPDAIHEVAAFQSIDEAVTRYFENINSNKAYQVFRTIRQDLRAQGVALNPAILATGLLPYSERGADYVIELTNMLRHNQVYLLDEKEEPIVLLSE